MFSDRVCPGACAGRYRDFLEVGFALDAEVAGRRSGDPPWARYLGALSVPATVRGGPDFGGTAAELAALEEFLSQGKGTRRIQGERDVCYIGWGSIKWASPQVMTEFAVEALLVAGCRGVVLAGWADLGPQHLQDPDLRNFCRDHVFFAKSAPHAWLFPKCAVIVHHGGAGTHAAALRAGKPSVVTPLIYDQFAAARAVDDLDVGVGTAHLSSLAAHDLADAIRTCQLDPDKRLNAAKLANDLASSDGIANASAFCLDALADADHDLGGTYWSQYRAWATQEIALRTSSNSCFWMCQPE